MPNGDTETVQFKSPTTGAVKPLGSEDWEAALSRGYKPVDHTIMFSPEGKRGFVPNAELRDYMGQGYQTTPETQFEKDRPGHGITSEGAGTAALETAKGIPGGILKLLDPTEPFRHPSDIPIVRSIREMGAAAKDPDARWWEVPVAGAGSLFGMSAESAREHARRGEGGSIVGEAAVPTAMAIGGELASQTGAIPRVARAVENAKDVAGTAMRTSEGALRPGIRGTARVVGAGLGHATGIPFMELAGSQAFPSLVDAFTPERPSVLAAREELLRTRALKNPAITAKNPLGPELPPAMDTAPTKSIRDVGSGAVAVFPEPKPESTNARPGAMWSIPREELSSAAMRGAPGAGDVLQNTGRTVLYEPRGAIGTGKSVTRFTSEGVPLQEGLPQGSPTPFGKSIRETASPALRPEVQGLVRSPAMEVPEWKAQEQSYELQKARDILRNLNATNEERAVADARLKESQ
jgi:hypothetical protein